VRAVERGDEVGGPLADTTHHDGQIVMDADLQRRGITP
jgi:hypothetical protein